MPNHHPPKPPQLPTPKQQRYLRVLAQRTRQTFVVPRTKAEASAEIRRLQRIQNATRTECRVDDREVSHRLTTGAAKSARIREDETTTTGFGTTARWA